MLLFTYYLILEELLMKKIVILLGISLCCYFCILFYPVKVLAEETDKSIEIDLSSPEEKSIEYIDEEGNEILLEVEPQEVSEDSKLTIYALSRARLTSGSYKVSKRAKGNWSATYTVTINSKKQFIGAKSMKINVLKGSISGKSLTYNSSRVIGTFRHKYGIITSTPKIVTTVKGDKLIVQ